MASGRRLLLIGLGVSMLTLTGCSWGSGADEDPITAGPGPYICEGLLSKAAVGKAAGGGDLKDGIVRGPGYPSWSCWIDAGGTNAIQVDINRNELAERDWSVEKVRQGRNPEPMPEFGGEGYAAPEGKVVLHREGLLISLWITKDVDERDRIEDAKALLRLMLPRLQINTLLPTTTSPSATRSPS